MAFRPQRIFTQELFSGGNSHIKNFAVEALAADQATDVRTGLQFVNTTDKRLKVVVPDAPGTGTEIKTVADTDDIAGINTDLADQVTATKGSALVGFDGYSTTDLTFAAGTTRSTMRQIIDQLQANKTAIDSNAGEFLSTTDTNAQSVAGAVTYASDLTVQGNLNVTGTTTTVNSETLEVADNNIVLNSNVTTGVATENGGISIARGDDGALTILEWNETSDYVQIPEWDATANAGAGGFVQREVATQVYTDAKAQEITDVLELDLATAAAGKGSEMVAVEAIAGTQYSITEGTVESALTEVIGAADALGGRVDTVEASAGLNADGSLAAFSGTNYVDGSASLRAAILNLDTNVASAVASGSSTLKTNINAQKFNQEITTAAAEHVITHNLNSTNLNVTLLTYNDTTSTWQSDAILWEITDANTITVIGGAAIKVKVAITANDNLA